MNPQQFLEKFPANDVGRPHQIFEDDGFLHDRACPNCGRRRSLIVQATVWVRLRHQSTPDTDYDVEWDDDSAAECIHCAHSATLLNFTIPGLDDLLAQKQRTPPVA